jgi:hypothetical protein
MNAAARVMKAAGDWMKCSGTVGAPFIREGSLAWFYNCLRTRRHIAS